MNACSSSSSSSSSDSDSSSSSSSSTTSPASCASLADQFAAVGYARRCCAVAAADDQPDAPAAAFALRELRLLLALVHQEDEYEAARSGGRGRHGLGGWRARHAQERKALVAAVAAEGPLAIEAAASAAVKSAAVKSEIASLATAAQRWLPKQRAAAAAAARRRAGHRQK
jgi:hypothetical protein